MAASSSVISSPIADPAGAGAAASRAARARRQDALVRLYRT